MKNLIITIASFISFSVYSQTVNNRIFLYGGFHSSTLEIVDSELNSGNLTTSNSTSPYFEVGYEYYLSDRSGLSINLGYGILNQRFQYKVSQVVNDSLTASGLQWNEEINMPNVQGFVTLRLSYVYQLLLKDRNKLSVLAGGLFRYGLTKEYGEASFMLYENEDDVFQAMGPKSYETNADYRTIAFNPSISFRYERITKYDNSYGLSLNFSVPLMKIYEGQMDILPQYDAFREKYDYFSRGGYVGFTFFYGIGFGAK